MNVTFYNLQGSGPPAQQDEMQDKRPPEETCPSLKLHLKCVIFDKNLCVLVHVDNIPLY